MTRKLDDWLASWLEYSSAWESPERLRLWSGISAISAALQRKVFTVTKNQRCYANMYILLIGPPGVGKGNAMKYLSIWLREYINMAPDGLTRRAFFTAIEESRSENPAFEAGQDATTSVLGCHHSLTAFVEELGVFLHPGDLDFFSFLCHAFDSPAIFHYKTQTTGENYIENMYFSMLAATTPKALRDIFSESAMETGVAARMVMAFSDEKIRVSLFSTPTNREDLEKDLKYDLERISRINGEYQFDTEAASALQEWCDADLSPVPKDPRFAYYNSRRYVQIIKLCLCIAAARRDDPIILAQDLYSAKSFLLEAERVMPKAIETLGANPYLGQQQLALKFIDVTWERTKKGVPEYALRRYLAHELDPRYASAVVAELANARWVTAQGSAPDRIFFPRGRESKPGNAPADGPGNTGAAPVTSDPESSSSDSSGTDPTGD